MSSQSQAQHVVWDRVPLGNLVTRMRRSVKVQPDRMYREIGIRSHGKGIFYKDEVSGASLGSKAVFWVEPDCFIVNIVFAWEQAIARTTHAEKGMIASHRFPMYKPREQSLDLDFLVYFFNTSYGKHLLGLASPGGAGRNRTLGQEEFLRLRIPLPPIAEQRRIARILATWDEAIALTERLIEAKQRRKRALAEMLLTGQLRTRRRGMVRDTCLRQPGPTPDGWKIVELQDVASLNVEQLSEKTDPQACFWYLDLSSVDRGHIAMPVRAESFGALPSRARRVLHNGDVIMAMVRPNLLGFALCDFEPKDVICSTGFAVISPKEREDAQFIYQSLYSDSILRQFQALATGSSYPALSESDVRKLRLAWPASRAERSLVAEILACCDHDTVLSERKLTLLREQKKGLMQRLLRGGHLRSNAAEVSTM